MKKYVFPLALVLSGLLAIWAGVRFDASSTANFLIAVGGVVMGTGFAELWKAARGSAATNGQK